MRRVNLNTHAKYIFTLEFGWRWWGGFNSTSSHRQIYFFILMVGWVRCVWRNWRERLG